MKDILPTRPLLEGTSSEATLEANGKHQKVLAGRMDKLTDYYRCHDFRE